MIDYKTLPTHTSTSTVAPIPTVIPGPDIIYSHITGVGHRTLWVVTVLMGVSSLVFYFLTARAPLSKRLFHTLISIITTVSFIVYLALATGQGYTWKVDIIKHSNKHVPDTHTILERQVQWLRYVNWGLTSPMNLINLALLSGLPGGHLLAAIAADLVMYSGGIFATFAGHTARRWVWFAISAIAYLVTVHHSAFHGQRAANNKNSQTRKFFGSLVGFSFVVKALYPIAIAAGPLALKLNPNAETIIFAVYDVLAQGIFGYWLLFAYDSSSEIGTLFVDGFWANGAGGEGNIRINDEEGA